MVFPLVMYGCERWTIQNAEHGRIAALEPWCWRRHLRVPWTAKWSNQSILKEISPEYSLEGLMLKLKLQYWCEELTHWKRLRYWDWLKVRGKGDETVGWHQQIRANSRSWCWTGKPGVLQFMGSQSQTLLNDWTNSPLWMRTVPVLGKLQQEL